MRTVWFLAAFVVLSNSAGATTMELGTCVESLRVPPRHVPQTLLQLSPTFVYDNWPSQADIDSLVGYVSLLIPACEALMGQAAYTGIYTIQYDPNLIYAGLCNPYSNTIRLRNRPTEQPALNLIYLAHEFGHMWRDDWSIWSSAIEEGLADAMATCVMESMPSYYQRSYDNLGHEVKYAITEQITNRPEIGSVNGMFGNIAGLNVPRYALANWVFWRLQMAHGSFLYAFQESLLQHVAGDPTFTQRIDDVITAMRDLAPTVDTVPFDTFWARHHVLDRTPPLGDQIVIRGDAIGCYSIRREPTGSETGYVGISVDWSVTDRFGNLLDSGTAMTLSKGQIFPTFNNPTYRGRVTVWFRSHFPNGTQEATVGYWYGGNGLYPYAGLGLFGLVDAESGLVTVETLDRSESYSMPIDNGQFSCPEFEGSDGAFRLVWNGREQIVRKDVAPYLVLLNEETTTPVGIADASAPARNLSIVCAPNPFIAQTRITLPAPLGVDARLGIYDVNGRLVRSFNTTTSTILWDGHDEHGTFVPSGMYFYYLSGGGQEVTGKVTKN